jgi:hypothetical protein
LPTHRREGAARAQEGACEIDPDDVVPHLDRDLVYRGCLEALTCIVEQEVDPAECLGDGLEHVVDLLRFGDVAGYRDRFRLGGAGIGDGVLEHALAAAAEDRVPAVSEKGGGDGLADAGSGSGDDGGFAVGHGGALR